jgi:hypothetical protein
MEKLEDIDIELKDALAELAEANNQVNKLIMARIALRTTSTGLVASH